MSAADARGVALASLERVEEAEAEAVLFEQARGKVPATRKHMICTTPRRRLPVVLPVSLSLLWSLSCLCVRLSASLSLDSVSLSLYERPSWQRANQFDDI